MVGLSVQTNCSKPSQQSRLSSSPYATVPNRNGTWESHMEIENLKLVTPAWRLKQMLQLNKCPLSCMMHSNRQVASKYHFIGVSLDTGEPSVPKLQITGHALPWARQGFHTAIIKLIKPLNRARAVNKGGVKQPMATALSKLLKFLGLRKHSPSIKPQLYMY